MHVPVVHGNASLQSSTHVNFALLVAMQIRPASQSAPAAEQSPPACTLPLRTQTVDHSTAGALLLDAAVIASEHVSPREHAPKSAHSLSHVPDVHVPAHVAPHAPQLSTSFGHDAPHPEAEPITTSTRIAIAHQRISRCYR